MQPVITLCECNELYTEPQRLGAPKDSTNGLLAAVLTLVHQMNTPAVAVVAFLNKLQLCTDPVHMPSDVCTRLMWQQCLHLAYRARNYLLQPTIPTAATRLWWRRQRSSPLPSVLCGDVACHAAMALLSRDTPVLCRPGRSWLWHFYGYSTVLHQDFKDYWDAPALILDDADWFIERGHLRLSPGTQKLWLLRANPGVEPSWWSKYGELLKTDLHDWVEQHWVSAARCRSVKRHTCPERQHLPEKPRTAPAEACTICCDKLVSVELPCGHSFCKTCHLKASRENSRCALCRAPHGFQVTALVDEEPSLPWLHDGTIILDSGGVLCPVLAQRCHAAGVPIVTNIWEVMDCLRARDVTDVVTVDTPPVWFNSIFK